MPKHPWTPYVITRNFAVSHLLLKMRCIFFTEQSYTDRRFGRLCNLGLPKTLRFSLQRHKTREFGLRRIPEIVCRFPAFASGNSCFTHCLVQKLQNSAYAEFLDSLPVSVLECFPAFGSRRSVSGFGLGLLVRQGFFDAKAFFAVVREGVADKPG